MFGFKVICWALLFIFRLRFTPGVSIARHFISKDFANVETAWEPISFPEPAILGKEREALG